MTVMRSSRWKENLNNCRPNSLPASFVVNPEFYKLDCAVFAGKLFPSPVLLISYLINDIPPKFYARNFIKPFSYRQFDKEILLKFLSKSICSSHTHCLEFLRCPATHTSSEFARTVCWLRKQITRALQ